jgi:hypothetical protein
MTITNGLRALDRLTGGPHDRYEIRRYKNDSGQLLFNVQVYIWLESSPTLPLYYEGEDPLLTRAIWDVLNIASPRTI